jgi:hypothetical protein
MVNQKINTKDLFFFLGNKQSIQLIMKEIPNYVEEFYVKKKKAFNLVYNYKDFIAQIQNDYNIRLIILTKEVNDLNESKIVILGNHENVLKSLIVFHSKLNDI